MHILDKDIWQEIFDSLGRHKLRTLLTAFGVFWGIFMLVNLLGAGNGLRNGAKANMGKLENAIYIWSGRPTSIPYKGLSKGRYIRMNDADVEALLRLPSVGVVAPGNGMGSQYTVRGSKGDSFDITGIWPIELEAKGFELVAGRFLNQLDLRDQRKNVVIGQRVQEVLFEPDEPVIGQLVNVLGVQFRVVGVIRPSALNNWAQRDLSRIYFPQTTLRKVFNQQDTVHRLLITPAPGYSGYTTEEQAIALLKSRHRVHPRDQGVIGSYNAQKDYERVQGLFLGIQVFSWFVAIGTIIAGVVGVGNIMLISVKERTKEIGIRKALGATPRDIVSSILQESLVITFFAGYLGLVAGVATVELLAKIAGDPKGGAGTFTNPEISFSTAFAAIVVLLIAGALASVLPARKAAAVDPVIALQDE